ncbi:hypothetical protein JHK82_044536 [Glycine max]|nr:hypothetical protein JHK82_044536 [Glycine max]
MRYPAIRTSIGARASHFTGSTGCSSAGSERACRRPAMLEKKRKKLEYEVLTLFFDKELKEKFDRSWAGKKWFIGDTLISLRSNLFNILHFIKK